MHRCKTNVLDTFHECPSNRYVFQNSCLGKICEEPAHSQLSNISHQEFRQHCLLKILYMKNEKHYWRWRLDENKFACINQKSPEVYFPPRSYLSHDTVSSFWAQPGLQTKFAGYEETDVVLRFLHLYQISTFLSVLGLVISLWNIETFTSWKSAQFKRVTGHLEHW